MVMSEESKPWLGWPPETLLKSPLPRLVCLPPCMASRERLPLTGRPVLSSTVAMELWASVALLVPFQPVKGQGAVQMWLWHKSVELSHRSCWTVPEGFGKRPSSQTGGDLILEGILRADTWHLFAVLGFFVQLVMVRSPAVVSYISV